MTHTQVAASPNKIGAGHASEFLRQFKLKLPEVDWIAIQREDDAPVADLSPSMTRFWPVAVVLLAVIAYFSLP